MICDTHINLRAAARRIRVALPSRWRRARREKLAALAPQRVKSARVRRRTSELTDGRTDLWRVTGGLTFRSSPSSLATARPAILRVISRGERYVRVAVRLDDRVSSHSRSNEPADRRQPRTLFTPLGHGPAVTASSLPLHGGRSTSVWVIHSARCWHRWLLPPVITTVRRSDIRISASTSVVSNLRDPSHVLADRRSSSR